MGVHKECGEIITWLHKPDDVDRFLPPMDYVGQYYFKTEGPNGEHIGVQMSAYKMHQCDPDKMEAWIEYQQRIASIKANAPEQPVAVQRTASSEKNQEWKDERSAWVQARNHRQENAREESLPYECRRCGAEVGEPCFNLSIWKQRKDKVPTKMPHDLRLEDCGYHYEETT